jgi:hypothetical protein
MNGIPVHHQCLSIHYDRRSDNFVFCENPGGGTRPFRINQGHIQPTTTL